jgi:Mn2+/Fe2+ NRAMP family transporter
VTAVAQEPDQEPERLTLRPPVSRRRRFLTYLAWAGPGIIAANAGNDAGGIVTYASAGAEFQYRTLFFMVLVTVALVVVQEMAARLGAFTGKGLAALIREEFSLRVAAFALVCLVVANVGLVVSEFAGIGAALELFGVSRYLSIPIAAIAIWALVLFGSYRYAERVFLFLSLVFLAYPLAAFLGHPAWGKALGSTIFPHLLASKAFILLGVALIGTTITPYMQLYVQSAVVEKGLGPENLKAERVEVVSGSIFANLVACFIIIATGATLFVHSDHTVNNAADAARALRPFAGRFAEVLFGIGLLGASLLAAAILPITAAYVIAETFGFEKGISHRPRAAPVFVGTVTALIAIGTLVAIIPGVPVIKLLIAVQVVNGVLLPVTLFFVWRLASNRELMGVYANGRGFNIVAGITVVATSTLSLLLLAVTIFGL